MISKYVAGREKDREFTRQAARHRLVDPGTLRARLEQTSIPAELAAVVAKRIDADFPPGE